MPVLPITVDRLRCRHAARGFTMVELLAVTAVIGIFVAASLPTATRILRDQRVSSAAWRVADLVRSGVMRARGRGSAVVVRWNAAVATPTALDAHIVVREAIDGTGGDAMLPVSSCFTPNWAAGPSSRLVGSFDERRNTSYANVELAMIDPLNNPAAFVEMCFTPRGGGFVRTAPADPFVPIGGVYRFTVRNSKTGKQWLVIIPPNGQARVVSAL